jgi:hypothetical protein
MRDPEKVSRAQRAAATLERAWERWRIMHGLSTEPMPPVSSYVGYSMEEPWGRPRVVFGIDAKEAELLAALLDRHECIGPFYHPGDVRARIPAQATPRPSEQVPQPEGAGGPPGLGETPGRDVPEREPSLLDGSGYGPPPPGANLDAAHGGPAHGGGVQGGSAADGTAPGGTGRTGAASPGTAPGGTASPGTAPGGGAGEALLHGNSSSDDTVASGAVPGAGMAGGTAHRDRVPGESAPARTALNDRAPGDGTDVGTGHGATAAAGTATGDGTPAGEYAATGEGMPGREPLTVLPGGDGVQDLGRRRRRGGAAQAEREPGARARRDASQPAPRDQASRPARPDQGVYGRAGRGQGGRRSGGRPGRPFGGHRPDVPLADDGPTEPADLSAVAGAGPAAVSPLASPDSADDRAGAPAPGNGPGAAVVADHRQAGGEPALRGLAGGGNGQLTGHQEGPAGRRESDAESRAATMAAELAGWASGELPGQASARLAAWTAIGGVPAVAAVNDPPAIGAAGVSTSGPAR